MINSCKILQHFFLCVEFYSILYRILQNLVDFEKIDSEKYVLQSNTFFIASSGTARAAALDELK